VRAGSALLAGGAGALAEAQLHAARLIEVHGSDPDAWAVAAAALAAAGLRDEALRLIIEGAAEEAA
jgi:methylase of polypeptide subunit release factors